MYASAIPDSLDTTLSLLLGRNAVTERGSHDGHKASKLSPLATFEARSICRARLSGFQLRDLIL